MSTVHLPQSSQQLLEGLYASLAASNRSLTTGMQQPSRLQRSSTGDPGVESLVGHQEAQAAGEAQQGAAASHAALSQGPKRRPQSEIGMEDLRKVSAS